MYVTRVNGELCLTNDRPRTEIGPQGDHVTAYALFKEHLRLLEDDPPIDRMYKLCNMISNVNEIYAKYTEIFLDEISGEEKDFLEKQNAKNSERIDEIFGEIRRFLREIIPEEKIKEIIDTISIQRVDLKKIVEKSLRDLNNFKLEALLNFLSNEYLNLRNHQRYVSFPRQAGLTPAANESIQIKQGLKFLRNLDGHLKNSVAILSDDAKQKAADAIIKLFFYPKVPSEHLVPFTSSVEKAQWREKMKKKKYNQSAIPRNNDKEILYLVVAVHLETICYCYPNLVRFKQEILKVFIEKVAQEWNMNQKKALELFETVTGKIMLQDSFLEQSFMTDTHASTLVFSDHDSDSDLTHPLFEDSSSNASSLALEGVSPVPSVRSVMTFSSEASQLSHPIQSKQHDIESDLQEELSPLPKRRKKNDPHGVL